MRVLVACEFSGVVRDAFRSMGHDAFSCDILPCEGDPTFHLHGDVRDFLNLEWNLLIAHPPCQYLSYAATQYWNRPGRARLRHTAMAFFKLLYNAPVKYVCVENPVGYPNTIFRKPDQIFHPYYFGDPYMKRTCLWLRGLPKLTYLPDPIKPEPVAYYKTGKSKGKAIHWCEYLKGFEGGHDRSRTFPSVATAMATQWGTL